MKRILTIAALCLAALTANAQTVEVVCGSTTRIFIEKTLVTDNATTFAYMEATFGGGGYAQFFQEGKWWETPIFLHGEYRTSFDGWRAAFAGISYPILSEHGMFSVSALARWEPGVITGQVGTCNSYDFGWFDLYGYTDLWYDDGVQFYWEQRAYLNLTKNIGVGFVLDTIFSERFYFIPFFGIRVRFGA